MIVRREWFRRAFAQALAALGASEMGGLSGLARGQSTPSKQGTTPNRTTVRRPALPKSKNSTRSSADLGTQPIRPDEQLGKLLESIREAHQLPGMIGAIVKGDALANIGAAGVRKSGSSEPMQVLDQVHLGSCTKAMTATLIGMLVDDGLLTWSSTIRDVFPEVASRLHPDFQTATLAHLLTHRAGLPHDASWWRLPGLTTTDQRRAALLSLLGKPPLTRPGTVYTYSNAGYVMAGLMAEEVSGQSWEDLIQQRLFEPVGMKSAGFGPPGQADGDRIDQPWGHRENHGRIEPVLQDNAPCMGPAGTVHCSVPDWGKFASLHLRGAQGKGRLLKPATFRTLHTPPPGSDYAGGWIVADKPWANGRTLTHDGSNTYWFVSIWIAPVRDFATLVATNQAGNAAPTACEEVTRELIRYAAEPARTRRTRR
jgi:CubicO group peptidase (beta-lactamase class C family)